MSDDELLIFIIGIGASIYYVRTWLEQHPGILDAVYFIKDHFLLIFACVGLAIIGITYIKNRIGRY